MLQCVQRGLGSVVGVCYSVYDEGLVLMLMYVTVCTTRAWCFCLCMLQCVRRGLGADVGVCYSAYDEGLVLMLVYVTVCTTRAWC